MAKKKDTTTSNLKCKAIKAISPKKAKKEQTNLASPLGQIETVEDDIIDVSSDEVDEVKDDAEVELSTLLISNRVAMDLHEPEKMSEHWTSPVYAFFEPIPVIEYVEGCRCHVFKCCRLGCKLTARCFLDKGDKSSTGNLIRHVKACWRMRWRARLNLKNSENIFENPTFMALYKL